MLKHPYLFGPCLEKLTKSRIAFFELLYEQVIAVARKNIRKQAGRSIGRLLSYQTEKHYPDFFIAVEERSIPARITIMEDIVLRLKLKEAPQRPPSTYYSTDLHQVQNTLNTAKQLLEKLRRTARRVEEERHLLSNKLTTKEEEWLTCIKSDIVS
jgi:hypothetical protein